MSSRAPCRLRATWSSRSSVPRSAQCRSSSTSSSGWTVEALRRKPVTACSRRQRSSSGSPAGRSSTCDAVAHLRDDARHVGGAGAEVRSQAVRLARQDVGAHRLDEGAGRAARASPPRSSGRRASCRRAAPRRSRAARRAPSCRCPARRRPSPAQPWPESAASKAACELLQLRLAADEGAAVERVVRRAARSRPTRPRDARRRPCGRSRRLPAPRAPPRRSPAASTASFSSRRRISASRPGGQSGRCQDGATGGVFRCWPMIATRSSPTKGGRPQTIS